MGTRSCIARATGPNSFKGVYHHWDGYPSGLGDTLFDMAKEGFQGSLEGMLKLLIDDHPAGWSTINNVDWSKPVGYGSDQFPQRDPDTGEYPLKGAECFCHGTRSESAWEMTEENAAGSGCEWVYAFDVENRVMHVLSSYFEDDEGNDVKMIGFFGRGRPDAEWRRVASISLDGPKPDWDLVREGKWTSEMENKRKFKVTLTQVHTLSMVVWAEDEDEAIDLVKDDHDEAELEFAETTDAQVEEL